jgi:hypothetical protein
MINWAIVVRHQTGLRKLFWRIRRSAAGDIYQIDALGQAYDRVAGTAFNPHLSYHADGELHLKSYDQADVVQQRQRPDDAFQGTGIGIGEPVDGMVSSQLPDFEPDHFDGCFEIPIEILDATPGYQQIHLDFAAPGVDPPGHDMGERAIRQFRITDASPHLVVSLFDLTGPLADDAIM